MSVNKDDFESKRDQSLASVRADASAQQHESKINEAATKAMMGISSDHEVVDADIDFEAALTPKQKGKEKDKDKIKAKDKAKAKAQDKEKKKKSSAKHKSRDASTEESWLIPDAEAKIVDSSMSSLDDDDDYDDGYESGHNASFKSSSKHKDKSGSSGSGSDNDSGSDSDSYVEIDDLLDLDESDDFFENFMDDFAETFAEISDDLEKIDAITSTLDNPGLWDKADADAAEDDGYESSRHPEDENERIARIALAAVGTKLSPSKLEIACCPVCGSRVKVWLPTSYVQTATGRWKAERLEKEELQRHVARAYLRAQCTNDHCGNPIGLEGEVIPLNGESAFKYWKNEVFPKGALPARVKYTDLNPNIKETFDAWVNSLIYTPWRGRLGDCLTPKGQKYDEYLRQWNNYNGYQYVERDPDDYSSTVDVTKSRASPQPPRPQPAQPYDASDEEANEASTPSATAQSAQSAQGTQSAKSVEPRNEDNTAVTTPAVVVDDEHAKPKVNAGVDGGDGGVSTTTDHDLQQHGVAAHAEATGNKEHKNKGLFPWLSAGAFCAFVQAKPAYGDGSDDDIESPIAEQDKSTDKSTQLPVDTKPKDVSTATATAIRDRSPRVVTKRTTSNNPYDIKYGTPVIVPAVARSGNDHSDTDSSIDATKAAAAITGGVMSTASGAAKILAPGIAMGVVGPLVGVGAAVAAGYGLSKFLSDKEVRARRRRDHQKRQAEKAAQGAAKAKGKA